MTVSKMYNNSRFENKEQRICGRIERSKIRIARILSLKEPQVRKRGYSSVEQIQDTESLRIIQNLNS